MTLHWADLAWVVAGLVLGAAATYVLVLGKMRRMLAESRRETDRRLAALAEAMTPREPLATAAAAPDEVVTTEADLEASGEAGEITGSAAFVVPPAVSEAAVPMNEADIPVQIQVAIAAAAAVALGNRVRVRSVQRVPAQEAVSPWTQQGRVIVQSSHNLRTRS